MNKIKKIIVFGTGVVGETAYYYLRNDSPYEVVAFTTDERFIKKSNMFDLPIIPFEEIEKKYSPDSFGMIIAVGYQNLNRLRAFKYFEAKQKGYFLVSYISSKLSNVGHVVCGDNCFILENQTIQPCSKIGNNVIMWSGNHIGHHSIINDHCYITSHVVISGMVTIEPSCFVGVNATIGHNITIGKESIIGAGSIINKSVEPKSVYISQNTPKFRLNSDDFLKIKLF